MPPAVSNCDNRNRLRNQGPDLCVVSPDNFYVTGRLSWRTSAGCATRSGTAARMTTAITSTARGHGHASAQHHRSSTGHQPISQRRRNRVGGVNGEIYNYHESALGPDPSRTSLQDQ